MRRPIDPKSQYTLWAQAISYLSMTLRLEVRPFGPPGEERNAHSLVWKTDASVEDEDNPEYGWPEFYVCLTMLEGDPERLTIYLEYMPSDDDEDHNKDLQAMSERLVGWALLHQIAVEPSLCVGPRGIRAEPLLSDAEAEALYGQPERRQNVISIHRRKPQES